MIKITIIIILILLLLITMYSYYCLSSKMIDYEKTRFTPLNNNGKILNKVIYNLDLN